MNSVRNESNICHSLAASDDGVYPGSAIGGMS